MELDLGEKVGLIIERETDLGFVVLINNSFKFHLSKMTSNAYGRLSVGNSMGGAVASSGYSGYGAHNNHSTNNHGTHNSHSNHTGTTGTHNNTDGVTFPNNVAPEDYLGKLQN